MKTPPITRYLAKMQSGMPDDPATAHGSLWQRKMDAFLVPRASRRHARAQPLTPSATAASAVPDRTQQIVLEDDDIEEVDEGIARERAQRQRPPRVARALLKTELRRSSDDDDDDEDAPLFRLASPPPPRLSAQLPSPNQSSSHTTAFVYSAASAAPETSSSQSSLLSASSQSALSLSATFKRLKEEEDEEDDGAFRLALPLVSAPAREAQVRAAQRGRRNGQPSAYAGAVPRVKEETDEDDDFRLAPLRSMRLDQSIPSSPLNPQPMPCSGSPSPPFTSPSLPATVPAVKKEPGSACYGKENQPPSSSPARAPSASCVALPPALLPPPSPPPLEAATQPSGPPPRRRRRPASPFSVASRSSEEQSPVKRRKRVKEGASSRTAICSASARTPCAMLMSPTVLCCSMRRAHRP